MRRATLAVALAALAHTLAAAAATAATGGDVELAAACPTASMRMATSPAAIATCTAFIAKLPAGSARRAEALARKGSLQLNILEHAAALTTLNEALAITPQHLSAGVLRVTALKGLDRWEETRSEIERLLTAYPDDRDVLRQHAQFLLRTSSEAEALPAFDRAVAAAPKNWALRGQRANVLAGLGRTDEAHAELDEIIRAVPNDGLALETRAQLFLDKGEAAPALADIETAMATGFATERTNFILARAQMLLGRLEAALVSLDAAEPDLAGSEFVSMLSFHRFAILYELGRTADAAAALDAALGESDMQLVLRLQVYLRNMGFDEVQISGELDAATKRQLATCFMRHACGGPMAKSI